MNVHSESSALVVSIHDVHPLTQTAVQRMLDALAQWGVAKCSLLVVPDFHKKAPIQESPQFLAWLHRLQELGHEIVLHGFTHSREKKQQETFWDKIITRHYTSGEGEFYDLSQEVAASKFKDGLQVFEAAGFKPDGFVAPAWLLSEQAEEAARLQGFRYTTRLGGMIGLSPQSRMFKTQSLVYSVRSAWRVYVSLIWNAFLFKRLRQNPLIRLSLHPPDMEHPGVWKQIESLVCEMLDERIVLTYNEWMQHYFPNLK